MSGDEERGIREGLAEGNPVAFQQIYRCLGRRLYYYVLAILRSETAAEDVVQDLFLQIARKREQVAGANNLTGYLFRMARNEALLYRRRQRPEDQPLAGFEAILIAAEEGGGTEKRERRTAILAALDHLPFQQQEVVAMKIFQEMTFAEIAVALDIPANTAASRYRYAVANLQKYLGDRIHEY
jgi:RNA polymerase sigma-70 factor, ECF subfamily